MEVEERDLYQQIASIPKAFLAHFISVKNVPLPTLVQPAAAVVQSTDAKRVENVHQSASRARLMKTRTFKTRFKPLDKSNFTG